MYKLVFRWEILIGNVRIFKYGTIVVSFLMLTPKKSFRSLPLCHIDLFLSVLLH